MTLLSPRRPQAKPVGRAAQGRSARRTTPVAPPETVQTPLAAGIGAALWSAALGFALSTAAVLGTWVAGSRDRGDAHGALLAGAQGWLLGNGTDLRLTHGSLTLVPLGLTLIFAALLWRSGRWAGRAAMVQTLREAAVATGCLVAVYVAVAVTVALTARSPGVTPVAPTALTGSAALAFVAGGLGVLRGSGLLGDALDLLPGDLRVAVRGAVVATVTLFVGGVVVLLTSLLIHANDAGHLYSTLRPDGVVAAIQLIGLCVLYVPVGAVWAMSYCLGPGFLVGSGTLVAPSGTSLGDLPAFPLLAALPSEGSAPTLALTGLALPVIAGIVLGLVVGRRSIAAAGYTGGIGVGGGALAGLLAGCLAVLAHGGITQGRMSDLGPQPVVVALWSGLELAAVGGLTAWATRARRVGRETSEFAIDVPAPNETIVLPVGINVILPDTSAATTASHSADEAAEQSVELGPEEWPTAEIPVVDAARAEHSDDDR